MNKQTRAIVVAGTHSGVGKTSISIGIMHALVRRGLKVQPFKVGPDFIDPGHHRRAAGRISRNLDGWMLSREFNIANFQRRVSDADIAVVEGVMGLFDGYDGRSESGSTAEMAKWLGAPVILVLDAWSLARSAAALIQGYVNFDPDLNVAGVIFNKIAGQSHLDWLRQAVEPSCPVSILGGIPKVKDVEIPERHLGLLMSYEDSFSSGYIEKLADLVEGNLDLKKLLSIADLSNAEYGIGNAEFSNAEFGMPNAERASPALSGDSAFRVPHSAFSIPNSAFENSAIRNPHSAIRIGVARDVAFCFYYEDNLDLLREVGADIVEFSPLSDPRLPDHLSAIYLGGGYPELYAARLARNDAVLNQIRLFAARGGAVYGECGGLMYLSQGIEDPSGRRFQLCGILPFWTRMVSRLKLAYAEIQAEPANALFPPGQKIRGHLFHFSEIVDSPAARNENPSLSEGSQVAGRRSKVEGDTNLDLVYQVTTFSNHFKEGFQFKNTLASYAHLHFGSNPGFAKSLVRKCHETNRYLR